MLENILLAIFLLLVNQLNIWLAIVLSIVNAGEYFVRYCQAISERWRIF